MNEMNSCEFLYNVAPVARRVFEWRRRFNRIITKWRGWRSPPPVLQSLSIVSLPKETFIE